MTAEDLQPHRAAILALASKYGARNVRVFGSVARDTAGPHSEVDVLVDIEPGRTLLDVIGLWQDLETLLRRKVDLLTDGGISPYLRDRWPSAETSYEYRTRRIRVLNS